MQRIASTGFSLVELLVTLCVLAIISSFALPNLGKYLERNRQENLLHSLSNHLSAARREAISQKRRVELCGSSTGSGCDQAWAKGWLIRDSADKTTLRFNRLEGRDTLKWLGAGTTSQGITYQANGTTLANNGRFVLCSNDGHVLWQLVINRQGRVRHVAGLEAGQRAEQLCK